MKRMLVIVMAAALPLGFLAGCGQERAPQVYKQGKYQGKPDTPPWENEQFKGSQTAWDDAIKRRAQGQNEYVRIGDAPGGSL